MYGKDDRSNENRKNMKQHKYYQKQQQQQHQQLSHRACNTSSSSPKTTGVRSIVDVADSSDEPRFARKGWSSGTRSLAPQRNRDVLDTLPPTDTDDVDQLVDGTPINENARAQLRAGDFKQMSQFPTMGGGHFTFGAEKEWNSIAEGHTQLHTKAAGSYFTLNIGLLGAGLQTIPFYKRMDYPSCMFTRQQIAAQNEAAERAEKLYQEIVLRESNGRTTTADGKSRAASSVSTKPLQPVAAVAVTGTVTATDDLDDLLALTDTQLAQTSIATGQTLPIVGSPVVHPATPSSTNKNDVEQWLDSVLDE